MNSLTTIFQASMYLLVVASGLMLSHAEGTVLPEGLSLPLAVVAWVFVERWQVLRLPGWAANLLGVAATGLALSELLSNDIEARLLSGAHFLVYLTWVVLFQQKSVRHYWWLFSLCVLQVTVGSVLTQSGSYGGLLVLFFLGAIWTATLMTLWIAQSRILEDGGPAPASEAPPRDAAAEVAGTLSLGKALRGGSSVCSCVRRDPGDRALGGRFILGTLGTGGVAMVLAAIFFVFVPRVWIGTGMVGETMGPAGRSLTGFSERVRLGDIGRIMESTETVLVVSAFDNETNAPLAIDELARRYGYDEPLFRGAVHTAYHDGSWVSGSYNGGYESLPSSPPDGAARVRQEVRLKPIGSEILPAMHPVSECRLDGSASQVIKYRFSNVVSHPDRNRPRTSQTFVAYMPPAGRPEPAGPRFSERARATMSLRNRQLPGQGLERLISQAGRIAGYEPGREAPPQHEMADRLVHWLRDSGEFSYSLDSSVSDPNMDPVEDFLFRRKQGHCEYYASALTLMLRAVDIPARMVSGFKGGKVNRITKSFEVEQRHAHAWVEAYIDGKWDTLDATPAAPRTESVDSLEPDLAAVHDLMTFFREVWSGYVVNLNIHQQREQLYAPLQEAAGQVWDLFTGGEQRTKTSLFARLAEFLSSPREWFSVTGGVVSFALMLSIAAIAWLARRVGRLLRLLRPAGNSSALARRQIEFYERFRKLCAAQGLTRDDAETHCEFAVTLAERWPRSSHGGPPAGAATAITETFYRVRFGDASLSANELRGVEEQLEALETGASGRR